MPNEFTRRDFIRTGAVAAGCVATGLPGNFLAAAEDDSAVKETRSYNPEMEYRRLGKTGLWVSAVCLGGHYRIGPMQKGIANPDTGSDPEIVENRREVVNRCIEAGINHIDACTEGEVIHYGHALQGGMRDKVFLNFAMWPKCPRNAKYRTAEVLLKTLDDGMQRAKLDYVDVWRPVASTPGKHTEAEELEFVKALETAKKQGKVRFTGVSSHGRPWLKRLCETYPDTFQVVLFPYTARSKEAPKDSLFDTVRKHDVGTFGIKPFGGGSLFRGVRIKDEKERAQECAKLARLTIRYILGNPAITAPIPGLYTIEQVDNMVQAIKEHRGLAQVEQIELDNASEQMWANLPPQYQWLRDWEYV